MDDQDDIIDKQRAAPGLIRQHLGAVEQDQIEVAGADQEGLIGFIRRRTALRAPAISGAYEGCAGADCIGLARGQSLAWSNGARSVVRRQCVNFGRR